MKTDKKNALDEMHGILDKTVLRQEKSFIFAEGLLEETRIKKITRKNRKSFYADDCKLCTKPVRCRKMNWIF
jgi:hypothetical protein